MANISRHSSQTKLTLFLMTEKGLYFLQNTHEKFKNLFECVVVGSDKCLQNDYESEIIKLCIRANIPFVKRADFNEIRTEYALAISWRWLIKHPLNKLIIFHDSLLPKYRGFSPLVNALINGEQQIGVSAIFGSDDFDTGAVIAQSRSDISYPITIKKAISIVNKNYIDCANIVLQILLDNNEFKTTFQNEEESTYSVWRDEYDYAIDWRRSSKEIRRFIDAVGHPYKGASTKLDDATVRILAAEEVHDVKIENRDPGKVLFVDGGKPIVICGSGMIKIIDAWMEGGSENLKSLFPLPKFRIRFTS